jgi:hypothetical protein
MKPAGSGIVACLRCGCLLAALDGVHCCSKQQVRNLALHLAHKLRLTSAAAAAAAAAAAITRRVHVAAQRCRRRRQQTGQRFVQLRQRVRARMALLILLVQRHKHPARSKQH